MPSKYPVLRFFYCLECGKRVDVRQKNDTRKHLCCYTCRMLYRRKHHLKADLW